jgi:hypothetical protein
MNGSEMDPELVLDERLPVRCRYPRRESFVARGGSCPFGNERHGEDVERDDEVDYPEGEVDSRTVKLG